MYPLWMKDNLRLAYIACQIVYVCVMRVVCHIANIRTPVWLTRIQQVYLIEFIVIDSCTVVMVRYDCNTCDHSFCHASSAIPRFIYSILSIVFCVAFCICPLVWNLHTIDATKTKQSESSVNSFSCYREYISYSLMTFVFLYHVVLVALMNL